MSTHANFTTSRNIKFPLLADSKAKIIEAYGMTNPRFPKGTSWYGVAMHGILVMDAKGVVTHRFMTQDYRDRPSPDAVLSVLRKAGQG